MIALILKALVGPLQTLPLHHQGRRRVGHGLQLHQRRLNRLINLLALAPKNLGLLLQTGRSGGGSCSWTKSSPWRLLLESQPPQGFHCLILLGNGPFHCGNLCQLRLSLGQESLGRSIDDLPLMGAIAQPRQHQPQQTGGHAQNPSFYCHRVNRMVVPLNLHPRLN